MLIMLTIAVAFVSACARQAPASTSSSPTISPAPLAQTSVAPPSPEELAKGKYTLPDMPRITAETLKVMMDRGDAITLIDARSNVMYALGHLPGSLNIPVTSVASLVEQSVTDSLLQLPKDRLLVFYCD